MKFYIDIGHGEKGDPGAMAGGLIEHQMNIVTGNALAERLIQHGHTVMVESGNKTINASASAANVFGADFLISQHYNAGGGDRGEVIHSWKSGALQLANAVADGLKNAGQTKVNVIKSKANSKGNAEYFGILRNSRMPSVIIEPCFIDNTIDRTLADSEAKQKNIGIYIADAIANVYGSNLKEDDKLPEVHVKINGLNVTNGYLIDNTSYVPIRAIAEALGAKVSWDGATKTVLITK